MKNDMNLDSTGKLTIDPGRYYKCFVFDFPKGELRDVVLDHMFKMSNIVWTCSGDFSILKEWEHWTVGVHYKKGEVYHGMLFADLMTPYHRFEELLVDGTFTSDKTSFFENPGVSCYGALLNAIMQVEPIDGYTETLMPGHELFKAKTVGDFYIPSGICKTGEIIAANPPQVMFEAYAKLQRGDFIGHKNITQGGSMCHFRMVVEPPAVVRNENGEIDPEKSTVKCIEQTNCFDKQRTDGVKTTWYVNHLYSFKTLHSTNFMPMTLSVYSKPKSEVEKPYLFLNTAIKPETLAKGTFGECVIKSNFPTRYIVASVYNKAGELVTEERLGGLSHNVYEYHLDRLVDLFGRLEKGTTYTMVVKAGICRGGGEMQRVEFTYEGK